MRYLYQPMSHLLNDMFGTPSMWGCGATEPHVWLFQQPITCRRRCQGTAAASRPRCRRPEIWEEVVDVSSLKPETIELRTEKGVLTIHGALKDSGEFSKQVTLPEGLVTPSMRCFHSGGKIHVMGVVVKGKDEAKKAGSTKKTEESSTEKKETAETTPEEATDCPCESDNTPRCPKTPAPTEETEESSDVAMGFEMVSEDAAVAAAAAACCSDEHEDAVSLVVNTEEEEEEEGEATQPEDDVTDVPAEEEVLEESHTDGSKMETKAPESTAVNTTTENSTETASVPHKHFHKKFNLQGFQPSEMKVKLSGRHLTVTAEHREEADDFVNFRQYRQTVTLPDDVILTDVMSHLSSDGVLEISAPVAEQEVAGERILQIQFQE